MDQFQDKNLQNDIWQSMKKKLLFIIESLNTAGSEKSLVTLLSVLDYSKYEVDLQLFSYGGELERYVPKEVNILPPLSYTQFTNKGIVQQLLSFDIRKLIARFRYSLAIRHGKLTHPDKARIYWQCVSNCIPKNKKQYDAAIGYAQGVPTLYVVDKVDAKVKLSWVNAKYTPEGETYQFILPYYDSINHIVTVSDSAYDIFKHHFPQFSDKIAIIWDIQNAAVMENLAKEEMKIIFDEEYPCLLTVARLNKPSKGYDISLETCKILKERGITFKWYAIGEGDYRQEMESYIAENNLQDTFILLGTTPNPYPYYAHCTIYVQTSRHEGYGLSIAEARILNKPVVTTEFDAVYNQMVQGKNGIVVKQDAKEVADAIERLLNDKALYNSIVDYQRQEKKGNTEEIEKFYQLLVQ